MELLLRRDRPRVESPAWHQAPPRTYPRERAPLPSSTADATWFRSLQSAAAWLLVCIGLAATVCGVVLLGWTWLGQRGELLIPGLACAAAGQFGLLAGLLIHPPALPSEQPQPSDDAHPGGDWLEMHRRIDEILRADLPERKPSSGGDD